MLNINRWGNVLSKEFDINGLEVELATSQGMMSWYFCRTSVIWIMAAGKLQRRRSAPDRFSDSVSLEEYDEYKENKKYKKCTEVNHQLFTLI